MEVKHYEKVLATVVLALIFVSSLFAADIKACLVLVKILDTCAEYSSKLPCSQVSSILKTILSLDQDIINPKVIQNMTTACELTCLSPQVYNRDQVFNTCISK